MKQVATAMLFDRNGRFLIYIRDDKPSIPFPNYWDLFGGHLEDGETPEEALRRELFEELRVEPVSVEFFRRYEITAGDQTPNVKHVFKVAIEQVAEELTLYEGQELRAIDIEERGSYKFANVLGEIIEDFARA